MLLLFCGLAALSSALPSQRFNATWDDVTAIIESFAPLTHGTVMVGNGNGEYAYLYSKGDFSENLREHITSATKWVTSVIINSLVEENILSFDDHPQEYIPWWTSSPSDARSNITLFQLMTMSSGFASGPGCMINPRAEFEECSQDMYDMGLTYTPGTNFHYDNTNLRMAAQMAVYATGENWDTLLGRYVRTPLGLAPDTRYDWPSPQNPDIGGGLLITGADYFKFLTAMFTRSLVADSIAFMETDHTASLIQASRPVGVEYDFHYGIGMWRECYELNNGWESVCSVEQVAVSSPGANGYYPLIDRSNNFYLVLATVDFLFDESLELGLLIRPLIIDILAAR